MSPHNVDHCAHFSSSQQHLKVPCNDESLGSYNAYHSITRSAVRLVSNQEERKASWILWCGLLDEIILPLVQILKTL